MPLPGTEVYMRNARWNAGVDSTPRIKGDRELCEMLHHVPVPSGDCHLDSDVWVDEDQRGEYEMKILGGCPIWQFRDGDYERPCHDDQNAAHSCDHFGNVAWRDDPKTPEFEGKPKKCGLQRDQFGPNAGFFMIPQHGVGQMFVRACKPDGTACAPWLEVTWR